MAQATAEGAHRGSPALFKPHREASTSNTLWGVCMFGAILGKGAGKDR